MTLASNGRIIVYASSRDRRLDATKLHTNFKLDKGGEYLGRGRDWKSKGAALSERHGRGVE